jgi:HAD superfamily hydrolase (TIGR01662 family)
MIRGAIFDLGSTLITFHGEVSEVRALATQAMVDQLVDAKIDLDGDAFIQRFNEMLLTSFEVREATNVEISAMSVLRLVLTEFGHASAADGIIDRALESLYRQFEACWQPMPDLHAVLDEIHHAGYRLGMISNAGNVANVQRLIDKVDVRKYFDPILISAGVGIRKPHPLIFEAVLKAWQVPADQVVMIGDTLNADVLGAQLVGMRQIWITADSDHEKMRQDYADIVPEATANILRDVPALIRDMDSLE